MIVLETLIMKACDWLIDSQHIAEHDTLIGINIYVNLLKKSNPQIFLNSGPCSIILTLRVKSWKLYDLPTTINH